MKPLSRRAVLRGIGSTAIALPLLEAMSANNAQAATPPRRLILFFSANGSLLDRWAPTADASGNITAMTSMMSPLEPFKKKLLMLGGVDMMSCEKNSTNYSGKIDVGHGLSRRHMLTGTGAIEDGSSHG